LKWRELKKEWIERESKKLKNSKKQVKNENSKKKERMQRRKELLLKSKKNYIYREEEERKGLWDKWWMIFEWEIRKEKLTKHMLPFFKQRYKKNFEQCTMYLYDRSDILYWVELIIDRIILNYLLLWKCDFLHQHDNKDCKKLLYLLKY